MVWFKVDDKLHSHPKTSSTSLAAMGLWAVAGSWCSDHLTDGRVPGHMITSLSRGAIELADELVAAGFWVRVKDGYRFHQWREDSDGTKRNPSKKEVEEERRKKADAGRKGGLASGKTRSKPEARAKADASTVLASSLNPRPDPTRPSPSNEGERASTTPPPAPSGDPPPPRCPEHINTPTSDPCRACKTARETRDDWDQARVRAEALARSTAARQHAEAERSAIDNCRWCDNTGKRGAYPCNHQDPAKARQRASRGAALAREHAPAVTAARQPRAPDPLDAALAELTPSESETDPCPE